MTDIILMKSKLKRLRLPGIAEILKNRLREAIEKKWSYSEFFNLLLTDEIDKRDEKLRIKSFNSSGLEPLKTLELFDFSANININERLIKELAECSFLTRGENIFFIGPAGVGKSHLGQAIGHEACRKNNQVLFNRTTTLLKWIHAGRGDGSYEKRIKKVIKSPLLILDDFGLQALNDCQQDDLYEIICSRYLKLSTIITSNRDVSEWSKIFDNPLIGSAVVDRLVHRAITFVIEGQSYRLLEYKNRNKIVENS
jgi:DNA replication protein DnaC